LVFTCPLALSSLNYLAVINLLEGITVFKKIILLTMLLALVGCGDETNTTLVSTTTTSIVVNSDIFGLDVPTMTPELFAPEIISTPETKEFAGTFSPDFNYYFFTRRNAQEINRIYYTQYVDGVWTTPCLSPISEDVPEFEPFITPDGRYLYFGSRRGGSSDFYMYRSEFVDGIWQEPVYLENELNEGFSMYISVSLNGNIYYTGSIGIRVMRYVDGAYLPSESTGIIGAHPYIAPDESYMLFDDSGSTMRTSIFVTFNVDGVWQDSQKLGEDINQSTKMQICSSVSPDGKYLFFGRFSGEIIDIYWLDAAYLDAYRPE